MKRKPGRYKYRKNITKEVKPTFQQVVDMFRPFVGDDKITSVGDNELPQVFCIKPDGVQYSLSLIRKNYIVRHNNKDGVLDYDKIIAIKDDKGEVTLVAEGQYYIGPYTSDKDEDRISKITKHFKDFVNKDDRVVVYNTIDNIVYFTSMSGVQYSIGEDKAGNIVKKVYSKANGDLIVSSEETLIKAEDR